MGLRYVSMEEKDIDVLALVLYSDVAQIGNFLCSYERLDRLQQNILCPSQSNSIDIPANGPQRDERMGWTKSAPHGCSRCR